MIRRFGLAVNRRRAYNAQSGVRKDINSLYKKMKQTMPMHMKQIQLGSSNLTAIISTTVTAQDIHTTIVQGDAYEDRHGTITSTKRLIGTFTVRPGSTQATAETIRCLVVRGQVGSTGAQLVTGINDSAASLADNRTTRLMFDKYYLVAPTAATAAYPTKVVFNIKLNHRQVYTSGAAGSQTGETYYVIFMSGVATGTAAPVMQNGRLEVWFTP